jgi:tetratricopeptide (TPR) repeat protein
LIDYLEKLVEEGQYESAIECAERLMLSGENTALDLARIHCGLLISRSQTQQYYAASVSGQLALKLARDLEEWDIFGRCCFGLGINHNKLGDPKLAISVLLEFFHYQSFYTGAAKLAPWVWFNLGVIHSKMDDPSAAIGYLMRAQELSITRGDSYLQHTCRHALVEAYLLKGDLHPIPKLMANSLHFLRHNTNQRYAADSYLWHMLLRANYALKRDRVDRAMSISLRALKQSVNQHRQQFHFHMLIAGLSMKKGLINEAFGHSLSARICAIRGNRFDYESQAMELIYQMTCDTGLDSITVSSEFMFDEAHRSLFTRTSAH